MKSRIYSLMVVDDHPIILDGLKTLLSSEADLSIDHSAISAAEAMEILESVQPDLLIIDLSLGDSDGCYLIQNIHQEYPMLRILVYSMSEERIFGERVANAGALGYVMKSSNPSILKEAIYALLDNQIFFSDSIMQRILIKDSGKTTPPKSVLENLSNREMDVFKLIGEGLDTIHIGKKFGISKNTVDTHRINIKKKLELSNGKALDRMAYEVIIQGKVPGK